MAFYKNTASQKLSFFAQDVNGNPLTGKAGEITAKISKDGGAVADTATTNPTEIGYGLYYYPISQTESNCDCLVLIPRHTGGSADGYAAPVINYPIDNTLDFNTAQKAALNAATPASVTGAVGSVTGAVGSVTGNVGGNVVGSVASVTAAVSISSNSDITAIKAKTDNLPDSPAAVGSAMTLTSDERTSIGTAVWASTTRTLSSFGTLIADIWAYATRTITSGGITAQQVWEYATRTITSGGITAQEVENAVWDADMEDHLNTGSTGKQLNSAGVGGDPLGVSVPGDYAAGTAGYKLGSIGSGDITIVQSPISSDGMTLNIIRGDDYRGLQFNFDDIDDLTSGTVRFKTRMRSTLITVDGVIISSGGATQTISIDLLSAITSSFIPGNQSFEIEATLASGDIKTILLNGVIKVKKDIR